MRRVRIALLWPALLAAAGFASATHADEPAPLRIEASVGYALSGTPPTTITVESDVATVRQKATKGSPQGFSLSFFLTPTERQDLRAAVAAARFFDTWGGSTGVTDGPTWEVTVRSGSDERTRNHVYGQPEFEPLQRHLQRFVTQANVTRELREGAFDGVRSLLVYRSGGEVFRVLALAPEIVACASKLDAPARCATAAAILVHLPATEAWAQAAGELLATIDSDRRGAVLVGWVAELRPAAQTRSRAAFQPLAIAELDASWPRYASMSGLERAGCGALLDLLLEDRLPHAFEVAERMAQSLGTVEKPFVPPGLLETGADALPVAARLLQSPEAGGRRSGAEVARIFASVLHRHQGSSRALSPADREALERRFPLEMVPVLERATQDAGQPYGVRQACADALDAWDGRVRAAEAEARRVEEARRVAEAERRAEEDVRKTGTTPMLEGSLVITGRLVAGGDVPLPSFGVWANRTDGRCLRSAKTAADGTFRVEGLAEGVYDLEVVLPEERLRLGRGMPHAAEGVVAGTGDVVLRLPGSLLHGRLLDATGAPAAGRRLMAQMRDAPTLQGPAYGSAAATTDAQGRFWFVRLLPGLYDLEVPAAPVLRGAASLETGPEERTVRILGGGFVAGRVVDETGAPLEGAFVTAYKPDATWSPLQSGSTARDGAFRLEPLDPATPCRVAAQFVYFGGDGRSAIADSVEVGTADLALRIDTGPRLLLRVAFGGRGGELRKSIRLTRVEGGPVTARTFDGPAVDWRMALEGTWTVAAHVRDVDALGVPTHVWVDLGTVRRGEPERTFDVPR